MYIDLRFWKVIFLFHFGVMFFSYLVVSTQLKNTRQNRIISPEIAVNKTLRRNHLLVCYFFACSYFHGQNNKVIFYLFAGSLMDQKPRQVIIRMHCYHHVQATSLALGHCSLRRGSFRSSLTARPQKSPCGWCNWWYTPRKILWNPSRFIVLKEELYLQILLNGQFHILRP